MHRRERMYLPGQLYQMFNAEITAKPVLSSLRTTGIISNSGKRMPGDISLLSMITARCPITYIFWLPLIIQVRYPVQRV